MARIRSGILGNTRGKVAGVVGSQWKDKNYIREYIKPANPNTVKQQEQRSKMRLCVAWVKPIVGPILNAFVDPFQKSMSGFNAFISWNIQKFVDPVSYKDIKLTEGKLFLQGFTIDGIDAGANSVDCSWDDETGYNGTPDDEIHIAVWNKTTGQWDVGQWGKRSDGAKGRTLSIEITSGDELFAYCIAVQKDGEIVRLVSNSLADSGVA